MTALGAGATGAARRLCQAVRARRPHQPVKFVLMNTVGNQNRDLDEPASFTERSLVALMRRFMPPHAYNERAADFLRVEIGQDDPLLAWVAVRPYGLSNEDHVSAYDVLPAPTRSAIIDPATVSRINVAHFMAALVTEPELWQRWEGQMPVIYNPGEARPG